MWAGFLIILGDQTAIIVAATGLVFIVIGMGLAYLVKLLDRLVPHLGSRLSLVPISFMCFLIFGLFWTWINGSILPSIENLRGHEKGMLLSIPIIVVTVIMTGWIVLNWDAIKGSVAKDGR